MVNLLNAQTNLLGADIDSFLRFKKEKGFDSNYRATKYCIIETLKREGYTNEGYIPHRQVKPLKKSKVPRIGID